MQEDKEGEIITEADRAIDILKTEGTAVAFPSVFEEIRLDMLRVKERLHVARVDGDTQALEDEIIVALQQMAEALKKAQEDVKKGGMGGMGGMGGPPPEQKLLDEIAELKMIKNLQVQVNDRTTRHGKKYEGEQADDPLVKNELKDLSQRQEKIEKMVKAMADGSNK